MRVGQLFGADTDYGTLLHLAKFSNPVGWELTATFTEQNEAESFLEFMNGTFPATLATQYGQCSSVFPQGKPANHAVGGVFMVIYLAIAAHQCAIQC